MTNAGSEFLTPVLTELRGALTEDLRWSWPGAEILQLLSIEDGHEVRIQASGLHYRLLIDRRAEWRAMMRDDTAGLIDALRGQRWIEFLLMHHCGSVTVFDEEYLLRACAPVASGLQG